MATIIVEEKPPSFIYQLILQGRCPPALAFLFRKMLYQKDANFEQVAAAAHVTTS